MSTLIHDFSCHLKHMIIYKITMFALQKFVIATSYKNAITKNVAAVISIANGKIYLESL